MLKSIKNCMWNFLTNKPKWKKKKCCMLHDGEASFRLWLCWWELHWQWCEDQQLLGCRGFVPVSPSYRWSRSVDRKNSVDFSPQNICLIHTHFEAFKVRDLKLLPLPKKKEKMIICLPGNRGSGDEGEGGPALCDHQIWKPASAYSCKSYHSPAPVVY